MEKVIYSNVSIPRGLDWRAEISELVSGIDAGFQLVKITKSGNSLVQISSGKRSNLTEILNRAIEKY